MPGEVVFVDTMAVFDAVGHLQSSCSGAAAVVAATVGEPSSDSVLRVLASLAAQSAEGARATAHAIADDAVGTTLEVLAADR